MVFSHSTVRLIVVLVVLVIVTVGQNLTIQDLGTLIGATTKSAWSSKTIYQFLGVRYAKSPNGLRRFKASELAIPNPGVHYVQKYGRPCPNLQYINSLTEDELKEDIEDCLHLSIHSRNLTGTSPVMVYIHGGSFIMGEASHHPPNYFLEKDVVLVVPQYRLGPLGFLSTQTEDIPGNAAVMDVILSLHWVKSYIHHFGGDPNKITLFGQSAGATIASAILLSPTVPSNLFYKMILQSGPLFSPWTLDFLPERNAKRIAKFGGCGMENSLDELNKCLINLNVVTLWESYHSHLQDDSLHDIYSLGNAKLTVGGPYNKIFPVSPAELIKNSFSMRNIPIMAGSTKNDGSFVVAEFYDILMIKGGVNNTKINSFHLIDKLLNILGVDDYTGSLKGVLTNKLYNHKQILRGNFTEMFSGLSDICSIILMKAPILKLLQAQAEFYPEKTYLYSFDYEGEFTRFGYSADTSHYPFSGGVHHSNDNIYLFPWPEFASKLNLADKKISDKMIELWTTFATTGVPKAKDVPTWLPLTNISGPFLHINKVSSIGDDFLEEFDVSVREASSGSRNVYYSKLFISLYIFIIFVK